MISAELCHYTTKFNSERHKSPKIFSIHRTLILFPIWFVIYPLWFVNAAFARPNTQQLLKTPVKSSLLHKIGCGSEKQLNKFIDFSLTLHNFSPPNFCTTQIKVLPLQQQNSFASRKNCRRVIFYYKL